METQGVDILRLIWPDVLGLTRSKDIAVSQLERAAGHGPAFCQATWTTTTRGDVLDGHGSLQDGLSDMVSRLDTSTIRSLPWEPGVAYAIADIDEPDGTPNEISPRAEIGWTHIWSDNPGLIAPGPWFQFHYDRWQVPPGAIEIARTPSASQAFTLRRNLAVQFHPELTAPTLAGWFGNDGRPLVEADGQDPDVLLAFTAAEEGRARIRAHALVDAFLDQVAAR